MERMLGETIRKDFAACERATNRLLEMLGLEHIEYESGEDVRPSIRGLIIEVIFEAGDRRQASMKRHLPGVRAILDQAIAAAKRSSPNAGQQPRP